MASLLSSRGYSVVKVADISEPSRKRAAELSGAKHTPDPQDAAGDADIIIITTPDGAIEETSRRIADSGTDVSGKKFIHMSGALSLGALEAVRCSGAQVLSIHPLQTFADLEGALSALPGSTFGVTCAPELEDWARDFVVDLNGTVQLVEDGDKVLYHAAAVLACNLLTMVEHGAQSISRELGFSDEEFSRSFIPLAKTTIENVERLGPSEALTGPLARGDLGTIEAHLEALGRFDPVLAAMYRAVCLWGLKLVEERGEIGGEAIARMRELLS
jgi:predicted short-subunit dehydrogenase-like oxidoreductase (DUF2520 family)